MSSEPRFEAFDRLVGKQLCVDDRQFQITSVQPLEVAGTELVQLALELNDGTNSLVLMARVANDRKPEWILDRLRAHSLSRDAEVHELT